MSIRLKCMTAAAAAAFSGAAAPAEVSRAPDLGEQPVYVRTDGLPAALAQRIDAEARKGLRPLRQYVQRTHFIHQLDLITLLMTREQAQRLAARDGNVQLTLIAKS